MVVNSPGTAAITNCPIRKICVSTMLGCQSYGHEIYGKYFDYVFQRVRKSFCF
jgi:hypothetical protein